MIELSLSVHGLVDALLRSGDIDSRYYNSETMKEGSRLHQIYQSRQGNGYQAEVRFSHRFELEEGNLTLSGYADGLIESFPLIEEIKSTNGDLHAFSQKEEAWHLGQAECYGAMYLLEHPDIKEIALRLCYLSQIKEETFYKNYRYEREELISKVEGYIRDYLKLFHSRIEYEKKRDKSLKSLPFPFPEIRSGQEEMMKAVEKAIKEETIGMVEAPTGIGKSMAALYPSLKALGKHQVGRIFYLTAKTTGKDSVDKAVSLLKKEGLRLRYSSILGRKKMCFLGYPECNPDACEHARNYYSKIRQALPEVLASRRNLTPSYVRKLAQEHVFCPFEAQLDFALHSDLIAIDYNYFFDPVSKLERFFSPMDGPEVPYFLLVDEAHNLPDRGRACFSSLIHTADIDNCLTLLKAEKKNKAITSLIKRLNKMKAAIEEGEGEEGYSDALFLEQAKHLSEDLLDLQKEPGLNIPSELKDFGRECYRYGVIDEIGTAIAFLEKNKEGKIFSLNKFTPDATAPLSECLEQAKGALLYSGTLAPIGHFRNEIFTYMLNQKAFELSLPSPFPNDAQKLIIAPVSIRYQDRDRTLDEVKRMLEAFVRAKTGNYFIFLPSFEYLYKISKKLDFGRAKVLIQKRNMSAWEKEEFLEAFQPNPSLTTVGISVLGGSFAEGVDLLDDRLIGVAVVGLGLPTVSSERELIRQRAIEKERDGFYEAYVAPGLNKVMQGLGRLIRSESDYGAMLLIDSRYRGKVRDMFEERFGSAEIATRPEDITAALGRFYKTKGSH